MHYIPVAGRILFSLAFIVFGLGHFGDAQVMVDNGMVPSFLPAPLLIVYLTGAVLVASGVMVAVGYKAKTAGLVLAGFLLSTAFLVWMPKMGVEEMAQMAFAGFFKDLSLAGAALLISHFGAGPMSLDNRVA